MTNAADNGRRVWHTTLAVTVVSTDPNVVSMDLDEIVVEVAEGRAVSGAQVTGFAQLTPDEATALVSQLGGNPASLGLNDETDPDQGPPQP